MKKSKFLPLVSLLLLFSCANNNQNSSTIDSNESSNNSSIASSDVSSSNFSSLNNSSSSSYDISSLKTFIFETINEMKNGNFSLTYEINNHNYIDVITKDYVYISYLNTGSVLLKTYSNNKIAYDFTIDKEKVEIKGQTYDEENKNQNLKSLDHLNKFKEIELSLSEIDFTSDENSLYTNNEKLINAFSSQLDFTGIKRLHFFKAENSLVVELQGYDSSKDEYYTPDVGATVIIDEIGTSSLQSMEDFLSTYSLSESSLENQASNLFGNVSFKSAIYDYIYLDNYISIENQGYSNLDIYNDYFRITDINTDNISTSYTYQKNNVDNSLKLIGLNGKNEIEESKTSTTIDDFHFVNKEGFELTKFRKLTSDDEYYTYLGSDATKLAYSITQHQKFLEWPVESIKVKVENNKVTQMLFYTGIMMDNLTGNFFYRYIDTRIEETPNVIENVSKKLPSIHDDEIKQYLSYLNSDNSVFTSIEIDSAWNETRYTKIVKGTDFYLKGTYLSDSETNEMETLGTGYYFKDNKMYQFTYDELDNITLNPNTTNKTFKEITNYSLSSEILNLKDNKITTTGDIVSLGKYIGNIYNPLTIDPSTFEMNIENDKISSMEFYYDGGKEEITYNYDNVSLSAAMKANLDQAIEELNNNQNQYQNWNDYDSDNIYCGLSEFFDSSIADKVPYLRNEEYNLKYTFDYDYDEYFMIKTFTESEKDYISSEVDKYAEDYKKLLLSIGYVTNDNISFINEKDNLKIDVINDHDTYTLLNIYKIK